MNTPCGRGGRLMLTGLVALHAVSGLAEFRLGRALHGGEQRQARRPVFTPPSQIARTEVETELLRTIEQNQFMTQRQLSNYLIAFGPQYARDLLDLGPNDSMTDLGSGDNVALDGYLGNFGYPYWEWRQHPYWKFLPDTLDQLRARGVFEKARVTGITLETKHQVPDYFERLRVLDKKYFAERRDQKLVEPPFGKSKVASDLYGVSAYDPNTSAVYRRVMNVLLRDDGTYYVYNRHLPLSRVGDVPFVTWLATRVQGTIVTSKGVFPLQRPGLAISNQCPQYPACLVIRKNLPSNLQEICAGDPTCHFEISVPELEVLPDTKPGKPPIFHYREK